MKLALLVAILGPAGAASVLLALPELPDGAGRSAPRRWVYLVGLGVGATATAALLVESLDSAEVASRGFAADPWRAGLAIAALMVSAVPFVLGRLGDRAAAALLGGAAAVVGSLLAADTFSAAGFLVLTTVAAGVLAYASGARASARAVAIYAVGDLAALIGLVLVASDGMRVPPTARGAGAAALVLAAVARAGLVPGIRWGEELIDDDGPLAVLALGGMRAQAVMIAGWVGLGGSDASTVMATVAALGAAWAAWVAVRDRSFAAASAAHVGLVLAGIGAGGVAASWGAVALVGGMFLGTAVALQGRAEGLIAPTLGASALGATLPGAALVVSSLLSRGLVDGFWVIPALAAGAAFAWLAQAGVAGVRGGARTQGARAAGSRTARAVPAAAAWAALPLALAGVLAVFPERAISTVVDPAARSLGATAFLGERPAALPPDLGLVFAVAALGIVLARVPARSPRAPLHDALTDVPSVPATAPRTPEDLTAPAIAARAPSETGAGGFGVSEAMTAGTARIMRAAAVVEAAAAGWLVALLRVGVRRGFL